jgi:hypothetical protein
VLNFFSFLFRRRGPIADATGPVARRTTTKKKKMPIMFGKILPTRGAVLVVLLRCQHARLLKEEEEEEEKKRIQERICLGKERTCYLKVQKKSFVSV